MALESFRVENQKVIRLAECENVPPIMVIAGPNGVGKSTLLDCLRRRECEHHELTREPIYISPDRTWRNRIIRLMHLYTTPRKPFAEILSSINVPSIEGIPIHDPQRGPGSADEAISLVKFSLNQLEIRRSSLVKTKYETGELKYPQGSSLEVYRPLKELTKVLLPHLEFSRVDDSNTNDVKCLWYRTLDPEISHGTPKELDIDDLSSGEKAIIALFLPFIEVQIEATLSSLEDDNGSETTSDDLVVLIDEPELHLHPALQARLLDYFRKIVRSGSIQFVIATHSSTFIDASTYEELYLLTPSLDLPESTNQLVRLTDDADRLDALRMLCGETYLTTACRPIICIEGISPEDRTSKPTDKRILEILCPDLMVTVTLPMGGRIQVIEGARLLRDILPPNVPGTNVFAIVDRDQPGPDMPMVPDWVSELPVCMFENFLLVPEAIFELLRPYIESIDLKSVEDIENALREIASDLRDDEIRIRVRQRFKPFREYLDGTNLDDIKEKHRKMVKSANECLPGDEEIERILDDAKSEVDSILQRNEELKFFRGKEILDRFRRQYLQSTGFSHRIFCIELARKVTECEEAVKPLRTIVDHIHAYVPKELEEQLSIIKNLVSPTEVLQPASRSDVITRVDSALTDVNASIQERRDLQPPMVDRVALRNKIMRLARGIEETLVTDIENRQEIINALKKLRYSAQKIGSFNLTNEPLS